MTDLEAFVLIGGRSSRMGCDKALLKIGGETLAQRAVNTVQTALAPKQIYLAARDANQFAAGGLPENIPVIYDIYQDRGAYGGLHAALSTAKSEWIFVLACDLPIVSVDLLKFVAGLIDGVFDAIVPIQSDDRVQPLCGLYKTAPCLSVIEEMLGRGERLPPLNTIFETVNTRSVQFAEIEHLPNAEHFFLNINSPGDLEKTQSIGSELRLQT